MRSIYLKTGFNFATHTHTHISIHIHQEFIYFLRVRLPRPKKRKNSFTFVCFCFCSWYWNQVLFAFLVPQCCSGGRRTKEHTGAPVLEKHRIYLCIYTIFTCIINFHSTIDNFLLFLLVFDSVPSLPSLFSTLPVPFYHPIDRLSTHEHTKSEP